MRVHPVLALLAACAACAPRPARTADATPGAGAAAATPSPGDSARPGVPRDGGGGPPQSPSAPRSDAGARDGAPGDGGGEAAGDVLAAPDATADAGGDGATTEGGAAPPPLHDAAAGRSWRWDQQVRRMIDRTTLPAAFRAAGYALPAGAAVYAARIVDGVGGPALIAYEAGAGAFSQKFWPASTVKVLAALAALEFVHAQGFTGAAQVAFDGGATDVLRAIVDRAIRVSSNDDYDLTVLVAGLDRLDDEFLTAERGFPTTILERSYTGRGVRDSPGLTLTEGDRTRRIAARHGKAAYGCPDGGNCADLFELTEAIRRVMLDAELPPAERFALDPGDLDALRDALCNAESSSFLDGATRALGAAPRICHKTGSVHDRDYLDHGLIEDPATGARYLLAASVPDQGGSTASRAALSELAEHAVRALAAAHGGTALQPDAGIPLVVQVDAAAGRARGRTVVCALTVDAPGADELTAWVDGRPAGAATGEGPRFALEPRALPRGDRLLILVAARQGRPVGTRALRVRLGAL